MKIKKLAVAILLMLSLTLTITTLSVGTAKTKAAYASGCSVSMNYLNTYTTIPAGGGVAQNYSISNGIASLNGEFNNDVGYYGGYYGSENLAGTGSSTYTETVIVYNSATTSQNGWIILTYC
jgi:hypothetical protein